MKSWNRLTRTLLITSLLLATLWVASPPVGEAAVPTGDRGVTYELTAEALARTASGQECHGSLQVCREECFWGSPTGEFYCFSA